LAAGVDVADAMVFYRGAEDGDGGGCFEALTGNFELAACLDEFGRILVENVS